MRNGRTQNELAGHNRIVRLLASAAAILICLAGCGESAGRTKAAVQAHRAAVMRAKVLKFAPEELVKHIESLRGCSIGLVDEKTLFGLADYDDDTVPLRVAVSFGGQPIGDDELQRLKTVRSLCMLDIHNASAITAQGMQDLATLTDLRMLELVDTSGEALAAVGRLKELRELYLVSADLAEQDLKNLSSLEHLEKLTLMSPVTGGGLEVLAALPSLWWLDLSGTQVTDDGLAVLSAAPAVEDLNWLESDDITDKGLASLAKMKALKSVRIKSKCVTDAGLKALVNSGIQSLSLRGTAISDAGLKELAKLRTLRTLSVVDANITDAGLQNLAPSASLEEVTLIQTNATQQGAAKLRSLRPDVRVAVDPQFD